MDNLEFQYPKSRMLCKVLLLIFFSHGRPDNQMEILPRSWPQVLPWPLPWDIQGIMMDGRWKKLCPENQEANMAAVVLVTPRPELNDKWTRVQKRARKKGPRVAMIRIPKNPVF